MSSQAEAPQRTPDTVELPAPTAWPIVLAFGVTLVFAGMVTNAAVSVLGAILAVCGYVGWFRDVLPHEKHGIRAGCGDPAAREHQPPPGRARRVHAPRPAPGATSARDLSGVGGCERRLGRWGGDGRPGDAVRNGERSWHLVSDQPVVRRILSRDPDHGANRRISTRISLIIASHRSTWSRRCWSACSTAPRCRCFPVSPILFGGVIAPILWSGLLHSVLEFINPVMNHRIDWPWFVISQIGFGIVAGIVVSRQERIATWQHLPLAVREGMEVPGAVDEKDGEDSR